MFVSYETLRPPVDVKAFVKARRKDHEEVKREIEGVVGKERRGWYSYDAIFGVYLVLNTIVRHTADYRLPLPTLC